MTARRRTTDGDMKALARFEAKLARKKAVRPTDWAVTCDHSDHDHGSLDAARDCAWADDGIDRPCSSTFHMSFDTGDPVRCGWNAGHDGAHFNSFAMRSWED